MVLSSSSVATPWGADWTGFRMSYMPRWVKTRYSIWGLVQYIRRTCFEVLYYPVCITMYHYVLCIIRLWVSVTSCWSIWPSYSPCIEYREYNGDYHAISLLTGMSCLVRQDFDAIKIYIYIFSRCMTLCYTTMARFLSHPIYVLSSIIGNIEKYNRRGSKSACRSRHRTSVAERWTWWPTWWPDP